MTDMERPHVVLLELLVRRIERLTGVAAFEAAPIDDPGCPPGRPVRPAWTTEQIIAVRPQLRIAFGSVAGILQHHGLIMHTDRAREALEQLGKQFEKQVNRHASRNHAGQTAKPKPLTVRAPSVSQIERSWSATELGRRVLGYYDEAAVAKPE
jgi:hypothetical protein